MKRLDVAIIGASLAGAACARELARLGIEAVAFERDRFPREKVCGGFLSPGAVRALDRLGILDSVCRAGAVEIRSARVRMLDTERTFQFERPGLGISRKTLDALLAAGAPVQYGTVRELRRSADGFRMRVDDAEFLAKVVVDAAGKLSRFTPLRPSNEFGVQFYQPAPRGDVLDFWFFQDGYGGAVSIEGNRSNACFLIRKEALHRYINRPDCRITGPVAYRAVSPNLISVGDAAGMIDPFCGEGMYHALDTGRLAALAVALGLQRHWSYDRMRRQYTAARFGRWAAKRALARTIRSVLSHRRTASPGIRLGADALVVSLMSQ